MFKKIVIPVFFLLTFGVTANGTLFDQAKWLLSVVKEKQKNHVGYCVGHSLMAVVDIAFIPLGWMDFLNGRTGKAHKNRIKADNLARTQKNLKKLIWFLKNVEIAMLYLREIEDNNRFVLDNFGYKFASALNEMRNPSESIADTLKRIHLINQANSADLKIINTDLDYYSTIRSTFCKR